MDPLSAMGVAASIAQFVNLGVQVAARLKEYNSATTDVPKALQHISAQLPLLVRSLERIKTGMEVEKVDLDTRCILKGVVSGCMQQVEKVDRIIDKVLHVPGDTLVSKVQKVFVGLKNDEKILAIEKNLQTYISVLILHRVIQGPDASLGASEDLSYFEVRVKKVAPFIERVKLMQDLEARLFPAATSQVQNPIVVELVGPEGAGKTQLAVEFCHQAKDIGQFQTVFLVNAATSENLCRSLESIADIVRHTKEGLNNRDEKIDFVRSFLENRWHPWLLVLDGYDHTAFKDVMEFLPSAGSGALLFTSRNGLLPDTGHIVQVPKFQTPDEIERLRNRLTYAIRNNHDVEEVESLFANGADPNSREDSGWPCLHRAVDKQNEALTKLLLAKGAKSRIQGPPFSGADGYVTALYWAASSGNTSITKMLLDHEDAAGLTPQAPGNNAILMSAAEKGHEEIVRMMVDHGSVHVAARNESKETPLGLAAKNGSTAVVKFLLDLGADAEARSGGITPLLLAASNNRLNTVKTLCRKGKANVNTSFSNGQSALGTAAKGGSFSTPWDDMVQYLLEQGADPNRCSENTVETLPLQGAARYGFENTASMLLAHGADPFPPKPKGYSPIEQAAYYGHEGIVNILLQSEVKDPAIRSKQLEQALILASTNGKRDVILTLLEAGVNIDCIGSGGKTPLLFAIYKDRIPTIRLLIRRGARQDLPDNDGRLPLFVASLCGDDPVVSELIRQNGSKHPDWRNAEGDTPLCLAALNGHKKVCQMLLEGGAKVDFENKYGDTPMDLAVEKGHKEIIELLEKYSR